MICRGVCVVDIHVFYAVSLAADTVVSHNEIDHADMRFIFEHCCLPTSMIRSYCQMITQVIR